jgi:hypothetical protein
MLEAPVAARSAAEAVARLDLAPIRYKLMFREDGERWSRSKTERVERLYRCFLQLVAKNPDRAVVPTKEVDEFWHAHILDTRKYADDCDEMFGYFLHHFPYFGMRDDADRTALNEAFEETVKLYRAEFGEDAPEYATSAEAGIGFCGGGKCKSHYPPELGAALQPQMLPAHFADLEMRPRA